MGQTAGFAASAWIVRQPPSYEYNAELTDKHLLPTGRARNNRSEQSFAFRR